MQELLKTIRLFDGLDGRAINALAAIMTLKKMSKGHLIIEQNSPPDGIYVLLEGEVQIKVKTSAGAIVVVDTIQKGAVFGTLSAMDRKLRGANCVAKTDVKVGFIALSDFQDLMQGSSPLALGFQIALLRSIFHEIRKTNVQLSELSSLTPYIIT